MVLFRLIQGVAGAAMIPSSQAILMETFPPQEQQMAMALWGVGLMVAPILGPTLGGWITDNWNWRWNFYINIPIGFIAFAMVSRLRRLSRVLAHGVAAWNPRPNVRRPSPSWYIGLSSPRTDSVSR